MKYTTRAFTMYKIISIVLSVALMFQISRSETFIIEKALVFLSVVLFEYLMITLTKFKHNYILIALKFLIILIFLTFGQKDMSILLSIYITDIIYSLTMDRYSNLRMCIICALVVDILYIVISKTSIFTSIIIISFNAALIITLYAVKLCNNYRESLLKSHEEITELNDRLQNNQKLISTVKYSASLEERNRLAARLHDKIGHNISGSIIMLEAAMLQYQKNPDKAIESVKIATTNLQDGVDEIRMALHEERPLLKDISSNDIKLLLEETESKYGLHTFFETNGDLDSIRIDQWKCIHDNATELITNTLKHSNGKTFSISLHVLTSMIKVQYSDNGSCTTFKKGLGLQAVEERTVKYGGKCFFEADENGFRVINLFFK